jgi:predicted phage terminase large subunit-like protein
MLQQRSSGQRDSKLSKLVAKRSPLDLAEYASPYEYATPPHLQLLNQKLMECVQKPNQRKLVSMPPRHGKSELTGRYFPAWMAGRFPGKEMILVSYEARFAGEWGGKAREVVEEFGPDLFGVYMDESQNARDNWRAGLPASQLQGSGSFASENISRLAGDQFVYFQMRTAGANGPITGKGAHVLIVDDPVKNAESVITDTSRDKMWDWWVSTAYTRLMKNGSAIVVQTRWHEDDLAGRLIEQSESGEEEWDIINLPAIAEDNDPLGREPGEALWPEMFPVERLEQIKTTQGPYWFSALYQGHPTPLEGGILKRDWMQHRYLEPPNMHRVVQSVDAAFKTGVGNDFSVISTWGTDSVDYYLLDVWRARVEFPDLKRAISDNFYKWNPSGVYVEDAAAGQSIIQEMQRETMIPVIPKPVWGNDISRATAISGMFQAGKVKLPMRAPWLAEWIEEHVGFPNAAHDDQVTSTYYALEELGLSGLPTMIFA